MKFFAYLGKAHRPTCKKVMEKGTLVPLSEAIALTPATCCHPERTGSWKAEVDPEIDTSPAPEPTPEHQPTTEEILAQGQPEPEPEVRVNYPGTLAKHFFRSLVKVGGTMVAGELGVPYRPVGVEYCAYLGGKGIANLDTFLPALWTAADKALKDWRKTSDDYKKFDLKDKAGAKAAFVAEQVFLEDFCAANTVSPKRRATPGFAAGAAWRLL